MNVLDLIYYFRAKLAESEAMVERLKRSKQTSRLGMTPLAPALSMTPLNSSMSMSISQALDEPLSPENQMSSILEVAKKDVQKLSKKAKKRQKHRHE